MKICIACGMPMEQPEDFAGADPAKDYCRYCARPDGSMQSYEEKLAGMTEFIVRTQGLDEQAAHSAARGMMAKLPAWQGRD
ncbi:putative zinc ribbon protein [Hydrogenispora ethanolica]|uniref:Putative zinc ribbon protein n=1 Tax=Hydrogenispora ethanolica TaxID=1082276 RepID=A0A4R1S6Y4_HYDET|nr:zinc ribbon domain-containing protein [Hydrogenispora ethanolica]TCL75106.1 putative zinc ribbon protein [Hydrogenispora ethanolica]